VWHLHPAFQPEKCAALACDRVEMLVFTRESDTLAMSQKPHIL
jgi:hypothetical protein